MMNGPKVGHLKNALFATAMAVAAALVPNKNADAADPGIFDSPATAKFDSPATAKTTPAGKRAGIPGRRIGSFKGALGAVMDTPKAKQPVPIGEPTLDASGANTSQVLVDGTPQTYGTQPRQILSKATFKLGL